MAPSPTPIGLDSETYPIRPGRQAPRVVCVQIGISPETGTIRTGEAAHGALIALLTEPEILIVGHNVAFDALATIATWPDLFPLWLAAYAADRVTCTQVREKLARIAQGTAWRHKRHPLDETAGRYGLAVGGAKEGPTAVRTRFHELEGVAPADYPPEFREYALGDLVAVQVYQAQAQNFPREWFADEFRRARGDFWLGYQAAWGMRTDPRAVAALGAKVEAEHAAARARLTDAGIVRPSGSKNTKAAAARMVEVCTREGLPIARTDTGRASLDADACAASMDPILIDYARYTSIGILRGRVDRLRLAAETGLPVQPRWDALLVTGRTSASSGKHRPGEAMRSIGDSTQNLPREPGLRECYVARPGHVIASVDWRAAELHGLAQTCVDLGLDSQLARVLNSGQDVHLWFACQLQGWAYEWAEAALAGEHGAEAKKAVKAARQGAKACMFGFPGGLGIEKFRAFARATYSVILSDTEARQRKGIWLAAFPEMGPYLEHAGRVAESGAPLRHFRSWRYRGDLRYTSAANSYFQGRIADMLLDSGWRLTVRFAPGGDLHGLGRPWNEAHDEILAEVREETAHEVCTAIVETMEAVGAEWCPACPVKAEPALQRHWRKGAEPAYRAGRLIPHEDRDLDEKTTTEIRKALASGQDPIHVSWAFGIEESRALAIGG